MQRCTHHIVGANTPSNKNGEEDAHDKDPQVFFIHLDKIDWMPEQTGWCGCCRNVPLPPRYLGAVAMNTSGFVQRADGLF